MISGRETRRRALLTLGLAAVLPAAAFGQQAWSLADLMAARAAIKSGRASFVERKYIGMLAKPLVSEGYLLYDAPGRLEQRTTAPRPERVVIDRNRLTLEEEGEKRAEFDLDREPEAGALVESLRATLAGDLPALDRFYTVHFTGDEAAWRVRLEPRAAGLQKLLRAVTIAGSGAAVAAVELDEANGDRTVIAITAAQQQ